MGKILVINGADFSANALAQVSPTYNVPTKKTKAGIQFMDYDGTCAIRQMRTSNSAVSYSKLLVANITAFTGKSVKITSATPVVSGAYYCAFTSDLNEFSFDDISDLGAVQGSGNTTINYAVTKVGDSFNVSSEDKVGATVTKTIPNDAKYLLVTIRTDNGFSDGNAGIVVELD